MEVKMFNNNIKLILRPEFRELASRPKVYIDRHVRGFWLSESKEAAKFLKDVGGKDTFFSIGRYNNFYNPRPTKSDIKHV